MTKSKAAHLQASLVMLVLLVLGVVVPSSVVVQEEEPNALVPSNPVPVPERVSNSEVVPGRLIVKYEEGTTPAEEAAIRRRERLKKEAELSLINAEVVEVEKRSTEVALRDLNRRPNVDYAEYDYIYQPSGYTDEPRFGELWGLDQPHDRIGRKDVDINGREASTITQGDPNLVVAVIDNGVDFTHPDLAARAWKNSGESGGGKETNGVDDDGNGYVDDVNGWDFCRNDKTVVHDPVVNPQAPTYGHGTHVAGTIAASLNGQGVVGVAPNVQIMALKVCGYASDFTQALEYAKSKGVKISNYSWWGANYSQATKDAIEASEQLFVAPAGNADRNNDTTPTYPASYDSPNILSVAMLNSYGNRVWSNYGPASVDISAPGYNILSSFPEIPATPAAILTTVESADVESPDGKVVTTGFGADAIGDTAKRASFFTNAFAAVDRGSQQVVLVDDDLSGNSSLPDVGGSLSAAIQSATGSAPEVITVPELSDGPNLSRLSGKTVVWATGWASYSTSNPCFGCSETRTNLSTTDQQTLIDFLNGGGKLILTGQDILTGMNSTNFARDVLKLSVQTNNLQDKKIFNGSSGTAFAGESYNLNHEPFSSTSRSSRHDVLVPFTNSTAVAQGTYPGIPQGWRYASGTSMAAAHTTGAAALVASKYPSSLSDPAGLKKMIMDTGKPLSTTQGLTVTGDMVDAEAALLGVINVSPARNEKGVAGSTDVTATFYSEMDPTTLTASTFTLTKQGSTTPVDATVTYDAQTKTATLDPEANLETNNTAYTATIAGGLNGVKDASGNPLPANEVWTFSTADTAAPRVRTVTPTGTRVARGTNAIATFSERMDPTTITTSTFKLFKCSSTTSTDCATQITDVAITLSTDGLSATLNPFGSSTTRLAKNTKYKAVVTTGITDEAGNHLDQNATTSGNQNKVWYFTTGLT